jgi:hypothetical protein
MIREGEFWRLDSTAKAEAVALDIDRLIRHARAAGLSTVAYILALTAPEGRKGSLRDASNPGKHPRNHQDTQRFHS